jgi:hypothetical protein
MRKRYLAIGLVAAIMLATAAVALAATKSSLTEKFSTNKHGKPTSVTFSLSNTNGGALPAPSTHDLNVLPAGTGYKPSGPYCSESALQQAAAQTGNTTPGSVCPAGSKVGTGTSSVSALLPGSTTPIDETAAVTAYAGSANQLLLMAVGSYPIPQNILLVGTVTHSSSGVKVDVPIQPIYPYTDGPQVSIVTFKVTIGKGSLLTTPKTCPSSHKWTFKNTASFSDGSSSSSATQAC